MVTLPGLPLWVLWVNTLGIEFPSRKIQINNCFEVKIREFMLHPPLEFVTDYSP